MQEQKKILIVDDDLNNIAIMTEILGNKYILKTAVAGEEALEIAPDFLPDVVLLDIMMPGMGGYEVCRLLREHSTLRYTKIIMVSAKAMVHERLNGYEAGADDYVTKPFDEDELLAKVRVYTRLKHVEELNKLRSEFTSTVTHEMRTPLTITKGVILNAMLNLYGKIDPSFRFLLCKVFTRDVFLPRLYCDSV